MKRLIILIMVVMMGIPSVARAYYGYGDPSRTRAYGYRRDGYRRGYGGYGYYDRTAQIIGASTQGIAQVLAVMGDTQRWEAVSNQGYQALKQAQMEIGQLRAENSRLRAKLERLERPRRLERPEVSWREKEKDKQIEELREKNERLQNKLQKQQEKFENKLQKQQDKMDELQEKMDRLLELFQQQQQREQQQQQREQQQQQKQQTQDVPAPESMLVPEMPTE